VELLSWTAQNEREEIKRKQRQEIEIDKKKGRYKDRPLRCVADSKKPRDRMTYHVIVNKLKQGESIKKITEKTDVTRDTVYRIKKELFLP
jgi:DNA invertase Pin-like site-specific DNA recombinase